MEIAHNSLFCGHLGARKTASRIMSDSFWPGIRSDVSRFCRSCEAYQLEDSPQGSAPLGKMPLINVPFRMVAVDLIGPIYPSSEQGHRYILTLVDYAARHPEAVPLKSISTETVAKALVDIYTVGLAFLRKSQVIWGRSLSRSAWVKRQDF